MRERVGGDVFHSFWILVACGGVGDRRELGSYVRESVFFIVCVRGSVFFKFRFGSGLHAYSSCAFIGDCKFVADGHHHPLAVDDSS